MNDFIKFLATTVVNSYPEMRISDLAVGWQHVEGSGVGSWTWRTQANNMNTKDDVLVFKVTVSRSGKARAELLRIEEAFQD